MWSRAAVSSAQRIYDQAKALSGGEERMVTGSDDFSLYLWNPSVAERPIARLLGLSHMPAEITVSLSLSLSRSLFSVFLVLPSV
mgnify:FL=1